eukprot:scaffold33549_cov72-Phaeocystis_antarctica.AAC.5
MRNSVTVPGKATPAHQAAFKAVKSRICGLTLSTLARPSRLDLKSHVTCGRSLPARVSRVGCRHTFVDRPTPPSCRSAAQPNRCKTLDMAHRQLKAVTHCRARSSLR